MKNSYSKKGNAIVFSLFVFFLSFSLVIALEVSDNSNDNDVVGVNMQIEIPDAISEFLPFNYTVEAGIEDWGNISSINKTDSFYLNVSEVGGSPAMTIIINFTGVTDFSNIIMREKYDAGAGHVIKLGLFDCDGGYEEEYPPDITDMDNFAFSLINVLDPTSHICGGNVSLRVRHVNNGNVNHDFFLDYVVLQLGATTIVANEADPLALHKAGDVIPTGNFNWGGFDITNIGDLIVGRITASGFAERFEVYNAGNNYVRFEAGSGEVALDLTNDDGTYYIYKQNGDTSNDLQFGEGYGEIRFGAGTGDITTIGNLNAQNLTAHNGTFANDLSVGDDLNVSGNTQLGDNISADTIGINLAPTTNDLIKGSIERTGTGSTSYFMTAKVNNSGDDNTQIYGYYLDLDSSGTFDTDNIKRIRGVDIVVVDATTVAGTSPELVMYGGVFDVRYTGSVTASNPIISQWGNDNIISGNLGTTGSTTKYGQRILISGTADNSYGLYFSSIGGGTNNYGIYDASGTNWVLDADNQKIFFGEGQESSISYDGTNTFINTAESGSQGIAIGVIGAQGFDQASKMTASGTGSFAGGYANKGPPGGWGEIHALGDGSIAFGNVEGASGGYYINASGKGSLAMGNADAGNIISSGIGSVAMGYASSVNHVTSTGQASFAMGEGVSATGINSYAFGRGITNSDDYSACFGWFGSNDLCINQTNTNVYGDLDVTGDTNLGGDLDVTGNATLTNIYGEMWVHNHPAVATEINGAGTYENVTGWTFDELNGFSNSTNYTLIPQVAGLYRINYAISSGTT